MRRAKRALTIDPDDRSARRELIDAFLQHGRLDDACHQARQWLDRDLANEEARLLVARLELRAGRVGSVPDVLEPLDTDPAALALLAQCYDQLGKPIAAAAVRMRLPTAGNTPTPAAETSRAYFADQLCVLVSQEEEHTDLRSALSEGRYSEAEPLLFRWIRSTANEGVAALALADWLLLQGRPDEAEHALLTNYPVPAEQGPLNNRLGDAALLRGDLEDARRYYRKATVLDSEDWNAWLDLARVEYMRGESAAAKDAASHVDNSCDDPSIRVVARQFLAELSTEDASAGPGLFGLAWTPQGGGLTELEVRLNRGKGGIHVTGNVGRSLEDAARTAHAFLRTERRVPADVDVHLNLPHLRTFKDGGSAGLLIALALESTWKGTNHTDRVGVTGEIGLSGTIRPIGGLREKILAAYLHGVERVFYPAGNAPDLAQVPLSVKGKLQLIPVRRYEDAFDNV